MTDDMIMLDSDCPNRLEVINEDGRAVVLHNVNNLVIAQQDHGRTLKLFVNVSDEFAKNFKKGNYKRD